MKKSMKKVLSFVVCIAIVCSLFIGVATAASTSISVMYNGAKLAFDVNPANISGRVMVPFRAIFEAMGATVTWDQATTTATGVKGSTEIVLVVNSKTAKVNGADVALDVAATNIGGRVLVPVRFVSENFGATVTWDQASLTVTIVAAAPATPEPTAAPTVAPATPTPVAADFVPYSQDFEALEVNAGIIDGWKIANAGKVILDGTNKVFNVKSPTNYASFGDATWTNYTVEAKIKTLKGWVTDAENGNGVGLLARFKDLNTNYMCIYNLGDKKFKILKKLNGKFTNLGEKAGSYDLDTWHTFKLVVTANKVDFYVDGTLMVAGKEDTDPLPAGKIAVFAGGSSQSYFDDISVTK